MNSWQVDSLEGLVIVIVVWSKIRDISSGESRRIIFTNHASRKQKQVNRQFYFLDPKNVVKSRTLPIQPHKFMDKYFNHFPRKWQLKVVDKIKVVTRTREREILVCRPLDNLWEVAPSVNKLPVRAKNRVSERRDPRGCGIFPRYTSLEKLLPPLLLFPSPITQSGGCSQGRREKWEKTIDCKADTTRKTFRDTNILLLNTKTRYILGGGKK